MRRLFEVLIVALSVHLAAAPAAAQDDTYGEESGDFSEDYGDDSDGSGDYGSLWLGPRLGGAIGVSGPRGGYLLGLELSYRTPYYFYYNVEIGFLHLLPRTITVPETVEADSETVIAPEHDVKIKGLFGIPITLEIGLRYERNRLTLRAGVGLGAMVSIQALETLGNEESEVIASFCFRPALGVDVTTRSGGGLWKFDLMYLWQDADFETTGNDRDVDSVIFSVGYHWRLGN